MATEFVNPPDLWNSAPRGYSHVVKVTAPTAMYFVAGVAAVDKDLKIQHVDDIEGQTRLVFQHIKRDLEAAGASLADIVKMTVYLRDKGHQWPVRNVRSEFFENGRFPVSTMIEVKDFCVEGMLIEIDAIAVTS
jgi:enamine deaminase RidA (YjgF/YER057c/UK114 family)